jgi:glucokinase
MLTIGTGIGGAIFVDGKPAVGKTGKPPEIGAMNLAEGGQESRLEALTAAPAFLTEYRQQGGAEDIPDVASLFSRLPGDAAAARAVEVIGARLAQAIGSLTNALALDAFIIGGGVSAAGEALTVPIRRHLTRFTWPLLLEDLDLRLAELGNRAGIIGSAATAALMLPGSRRREVPAA